MKNYNISYKNKINNWDEGLPLGSGKLGCLIYGDDTLRFALDRVDLWDNRPTPATLEKEFNYNHLKELVASNAESDWKEFNRMFNEVTLNTPYPSKITAGRFELNFDKKLERKIFSVDIRTAIATIKVGDTQSIETFVSAAKHVGIAKINGGFSLDIHIPEYISKSENEGGLNYPKAQIKEENNFIWFSQQTFTEFEYGIIIYRKQIEDTSYLYYTIATNNDSDNFIDESKKQLIQIANEEYDKLKEEHIAYWKKYWKQSKISIEDRNLEKLYYRSWYIFASCSRKGFYPMPLQGVWTADDDMLPPWKGDYHYDTNIQLSYQSYLKANHLEEGEVLLDYLWGLKSTFEKYAKEFYDVEGLLIPATATLLGKPIGGWAHYAFSPTMTIWAIQSFDEYYLYTGDEIFFKNKVYPLFKEVGVAIYQLLEERNGKLYLPLSSSPEIFDDTRKAYLKPNSNFDLALMRYLYQRLICFSEKMGESSEDYKIILSKLDDIAIRDLRQLPPGRNYDGFSVMLNSEYPLEESHRHFSHLMCLYPLHLINYDTEKNKLIYEGSIEELERFGTGRWVGYSFAMCAQIYAMAYKGNSAYKKLQDFENGFVAENGFHLNGDFKNYGYSSFHYRPFTLEALYGYCDAIHEMLLQDHQGYIHLFPAIPDKWSNISFTNLRSQSGVLISAKMKNKVIKSITLKTKTNIEVKIKNNLTVNESIIVKNNALKRTFTANGDGLFVVELKKGRNKIYL